MNQLVLAYSGGLDTTYCAVYLSKIKKYNVKICVIIIIICCEIITNLATFVVG